MLVSKQMTSLRLTWMKPVPTLIFPLSGLALRKDLEPSSLLLQTITKPSLVCLTKMSPRDQQSTRFC